jgi:hypothetical protein
MPAVKNETGKPEVVLTRAESTMIPELTKSHRCDRCGAQAYAAALLPNAFHPLMFCVHHWREHEAAIRPLAEAVLDETAKLYESVKAQKEDVPSWLRK